MSLLLPLDSTSAREVLFIGDSWAKQAERKPLATMPACTGVRLVNEGIGGTTAAQWASDSHAEKLSEILNSNKDAAAVWVSLGGNDLLETACNAPEVEADLRKVIGKVVEQLPSAAVLLTGYGVPLCGPVFEDGGCSMASFEELHGHMSALAEEVSNVHYANITLLFGGTVTSPSKSEYFADCIHLSAAGYERFFADPEVSQALCPGSAATDHASGSRVPLGVALLVGMLLRWV